MPFFKTAYFPQGSEELVSHYTAARMRVTGAGSLLMTMHSLDNVIESELLPLTMASVTNREPTRIMNFMQQRAAFSGRTEELNDYMRINRIILFTKPTYTSYPGTD